MEKKITKALSHFRKLTDWFRPQPTRNQTYEGKFVTSILNFFVKMIDMYVKIWDLPTRMYEVRKILKTCLDAEYTRLSAKIDVNSSSATLHQKVIARLASVRDKDPAMYISTVQNIFNTVEVSNTVFENYRVLLEVVGDVTTLLLLSHYMNQVFSFGFNAEAAISSFDRFKSVCTNIDTKASSIHKVGQEKAWIEIKDEIEKLIDRGGVDSFADVVLRTVKKYAGWNSSGFVIATDDDLVYAPIQIENRMDGSDSVLYSFIRTSDVFSSTSYYNFRPKRNLDVFMVNLLVNRKNAVKSDQLEEQFRNLIKGQTKPGDVHKTISNTYKPQASIFQVYQVDCTNDPSISPCEEKIISNNVNNSRTIRFTDGVRVDTYNECIVDSTHYQQYTQTVQLCVIY